MKKLLYLKMSVVILFITTVCTSAAYAELPIEWRYDGSAGVLNFNVNGNTDPANGSMAYENGIWKIETFAKPFYPRLQIPLTNISAKPTLKLRIKTTSNDYVFLWTSIRGKGYYSGNPSQADKTQEIDSEGNWTDVTVDFSDIKTSSMPNFLDTIGFVQISFRGTAGANNWINAQIEIDEIVLGGDLSSGIHETALENVSVFPTIAKDVINISAPAGKEAAVEVFNVVGAKVFSRRINDFEGNSSVNIRDIQAGTYFLNITVDGKKSFNKFIKQ